MITYHYKCQQDHVTEVVCKISERPAEIKCPECKTDAVRYIVPNEVGFRLKGEGWYETMHKSALDRRNMYEKD